VARFLQRGTPSMPGDVVRVNEVSHIETAAPYRRRLKDLLSELQFLEAQVQVLSESAAAHHRRDVGLRLAALHRQLDELERRIRNRSISLGQFDRVDVRELRQRLASLAYRHPDYRGPERRRSHQARPERDRAH